MSAGLSAMFVEAAARLAKAGAYQEALRSLFNAHHCRDLTAAHRKQIMEISKGISAENPTVARLYANGMQHIAQQELALIRGARR